MHPALSTGNDINHQFHLILVLGGCCNKLGRVSKGNVTHCILHFNFKFSVELDYIEKTAKIVFGCVYRLL